ncbi:S26 family signal peptidase [Geothermobacter hydrogeniphilus]|uniref:Peptidase S26 domain-containing protein n=1 Tax=Geothermobacter hydrogeniphilus TaxID=1969733 RepID=A0A1X0XX87_9BACT|nr:S26 family signal peptidase [Geothermobacter hydrogeniphilus]ORJ57505.1 hypothetical protein B5V00_13730 [Geothermobacter hydrogeniphilus]
MTAEKPTGKKLKWICMSMAVVAALIGSMLPGRLFITLTPSIRYRLLWLTSDVWNVRHGDYVAFRVDRKRLQGLLLPESWTEDADGMITAIKRIGCDEGETLLRTGAGGRDFYCGDEFLGRAKKVSRKGEPLQPAQIEGVIPQGMAFMAGDSKDSFDSRYFGLVDKRAFLKRATGIF